MLDYKQTEMLFNNAINFAEAYHKYKEKMKEYEKTRTVSSDDHIYDYYKVTAYEYKGKAEGIRLTLLAVGRKSNKMTYLDALLRK